MYTLHTTFEYIDSLRLYVNLWTGSVQPINFIIGRSNAGLGNPNEFKVNRFVRYNVQSVQWLQVKRDRWGFGGPKVKDMLPSWRRLNERCDPEA
ncbi:hypothetical protein BpHYR1_009380 [Brachionus plicatilis]|uniref:Uncharacterized protein n=1 Tax=Brachionus plicatilis TaxID=10195 RepID=A0A3M7Q7I1_BRAPC|nr:hypothetical protein BpHYR1_009380 [Brachionus plicatilis]